MQVQSFQVSEQLRRAVLAFLNILRVTVQFNFLTTMTICEMWLMRTYRFGKFACLFRLVEDLVVENWIIQSKTKTDGMCRLHFIFADGQGSIIGLPWSFYGSWKRKKKITIELNDYSSQVSRTFKCILHFFKSHLVIKKKSEPHQVVISWQNNNKCLAISFKSGTMNPNWKLSLVFFMVTAMCWSTTYW